MTQYNTEVTLNALQKEVYGDDLVRLMPDNRLLLDKIKFSSAAMLGDKHIQPVQLSHEHGFASGSGAFSLATHIAANYKEAQVNSQMVVLRTAIGYDAAQRMTSSKSAFLTGSETIIAAMMSSAVQRAEVLMRYGGVGLGVIEDITSHVITFTAASFAPGIWSGMEDAVLESRTSGGSAHDAALVITNVDLDNRQITVSGDSATVNNDVLYFAGSYGNEMNGVDKIITNTGELYNINASTYNLWKGSSYSAGSASLTMAKVLKAASKAAARGCKGGDLMLLCNPDTFANLNADQAALREYPQAGKAENGFQEIVYNTTAGKVTVISDPLIKAGEAFLVPAKHCKRIGSTDITFKRPGRSDDQVWLELPSNAGFEVRLMFSFNVFIEKPAYCVKITGIVNS